jgi:hypothetical protein
MVGPACIELRTASVFEVGEVGEAEIALIQLRHEALERVVVTFAVVQEATERAREDLEPVDLRFEGDEELEEGLSPVALGSVRGLQPDSSDAATTERVRC